MEVKMDTATVGARNQVVIPMRVRQKTEGMGPGRKVRVYSVDKHTVVIKADEQSWLENSYGLMKRAWKGVRVDKLIDKARDQW